jgi:multidrug efflux pump subunit AcrA (membrane-fusion protein)
MLVLGAMPLVSGCTATTEADAAKPEAVATTRVGTVNQITLTAKASERLGMKTAAVVAGPASGQLAIPHSALLYDPDGKAFVYASPKALVFRRADVMVLRINADTVILTSGPAVGTSVVTVGASELFGVDSGVGGGH